MHSEINKAVLSVLGWIIGYMEGRDWVIPELFTTEWFIGGVGIVITGFIVWLVPNKNHGKLPETQV